MMVLADAEDTLKCLVLESPCNVLLLIGKGIASGLAHECVHCLKQVRGLGAHCWCSGTCTAEGELCHPPWPLACSGCWLRDASLVLGHHETSIA